MVSLDNLMTFPFVREAVEDEELTLHGLWNDIGEGDLWWFDPTERWFRAGLTGVFPIARLRAHSLVFWGALPPAPKSMISTIPPRYLLTEDVR